ncbi:signal peptidase I, partial [bacterium]|nr:signal peptidase I [bacterium]
MQIKENKVDSSNIGKQQNTYLRKYLKNFSTFAIEAIKAVVISLIIILPIRYFLIQPFYVKGASMEPTFSNHDYLIINEIGYRFDDPKRGDVVIFKYPNDKKQYFIKRVIGLPNERVEVKNNKVFVYNDEFLDGVEVNEEYLNDDD